MYITHPERRSSRESPEVPQWGGDGARNGYRKGRGNTRAPQSGAEGGEYGELGFTEGGSI